MTTLRVLNIVEGTSVDGPGLRTSIYVAGCNHHCPQCHNPQSWDAHGGTERPLDQLLHIIAQNEAPVTLSGGDPLQQPIATGELIHRIKAELGYNVWCYTGYRWEAILRDPTLLKAICEADVVVDGPYIAAQRDTSLRFCGSRNQRLIAVQPSLASQSIVKWE